MHKKRSPIFSKAMELVVRKPIGRKLLLFKKAKSFRLLKHYNYGYIGEYEFSPCSTPLFHHPPMAVMEKRRRRKWFLCLLCGGAGTESIADGYGLDESEIVSSNAEGISDEINMTPEASEAGGEDDAVDRRAEKFIERFYQQMRLQRQESLLQYKEMLQRSCS